MTAALTFSLIIPTIGRPEVLADALECVAATTPLPREVLVVDGSDDRSAEAVVAAVRDRLPVRHIRSPRGLTTQRNRGLDEAVGELVLYVDDDAKIPPQTFAVLANVFTDPQVVGATGYVDEPGSSRVLGKESLLRRVLFPGGPEGTFTRAGYPRRLTDLSTPRDVEFMQGCFMAVRREDALEVRFDEHLRDYALAEDEDFSCRLARRGRIRFIPDLVVRHDNLGYGTRDRRGFARMVVVNRTYLFRKNFRQTSRARLEFGLLVAGLFAHRLANADWKGALGLWDGVREVMRRPQ